MCTLNLILQIKRVRSKNFPSLPFAASDAQKSPVFTHAYYFTCHLNTFSLDILKSKKEKCAKSAGAKSKKTSQTKKQKNDLPSTEIIAAKLTVLVGDLARSLIQRRGKAMWWLLSVKADLYRSDCSDNGDCLSYLSVDQILTARPWSNFSAN